MEHRKYEVYSAEFNMSAINQCKKRGMTIKTFAEFVGVRTSTFYFWLRKYRKATINKFPNKLIDITSFVKNDNIPIVKFMTSHKKFRSIIGGELEVDDNIL